MDATTLRLLLVVLAATLIRSSFGFGEALIAVPLLALSMPVPIAVPLAMLLSITIAAVVIAQDWRHIHVRSTGWLLVATFAGTPLGTAMLTFRRDWIVKAALAVVIMTFSSFCLLGRRTPELARDSRRWLLGCGFAAGVLGGAYGMNGPPLVIYGAIRRWSPQQFRATLQGYFLPASAAAMAGCWMAGLWVPAVTHDYLISLPVVLPAIFAGRAINQRLRSAVFLKYIHAGLVCIGVLLLVQAVQSRSPDAAQPHPPSREGRAMGTHPRHTHRTDQNGRSVEKPR
jgi:uncharacterized membrane protein YfcA